MERKRKRSHHLVPRRSPPCLPHPLSLLRLLRGRRLLRLLRGRRRARLLGRARCGRGRSG